MPRMILVLNSLNLNFPGKRQPHIHGHDAGMSD